jgi:serine/threonine protein kinase
VAIQVAEAVQAAHEVGLIHRDLTPDNIYLTRDNRVKVLDFGIAKVLNEIGFITHKDIVMGSILYMSPEQVQGLPLTPRSDICALGLMMFEMLTGSHPSLLIFERDLHERNEPYRRAMLAELPPIQMNRMPPMLSELDPSIPAQLARVVHRAITKSADARFATMRDFVSALRVFREPWSTEAKRTLQRGNERDLSLCVSGDLDDPPDSQRATPRRGLAWNGDDSLAPVPSARAELSVTAMMDATAASDARASTAPKRARGARSLASARNGLIAACLFGGALASLGALRHFDTSNRVERGPAMGPPKGTNSLVASLSPALPLATPKPTPVLSPPPQQGRSNVTDGPRTSSSPTSHEPLTHNLAPVAPATGTPRTATVSVGSTDKITDVSRPLEIAGDSERQIGPATSAEEPRKRLNGGKPIYGD